MIDIVFKSLEKSDFAKDAVQERLGDVLEKFPALQNHRLLVTLSMENSPQQPGADVYTVQLHFQGPDFPNLHMEKSAGNLYEALASVREHLGETLNRKNEKARVKARKQERALRAAGLSADTYPIDGTGLGVALENTTNEGNEEKHEDERQTAAS